MIRRRSNLPIVGGAALLLIVTFLLASAPRPPLVEILPAPPVEITGPAVTAEESASAEAEFELPLPEGDPFTLPSWIPALLRVLAGGAVLLGIAWFIRRLLQLRIRAHRETAAAPSGEAVEIIDLDEEQFAETVTQTVAQLRHGIPVQGAVVECWRRLEGLAAETGIRRGLSQTSHEFTVEVLRRARVDASAITELGELYRQAMFSTHALSEADRERAISSLEALSGQLKGAP